MNRAPRWSGIAFAAALTIRLAHAQTTELVSVDSSGTQGNLASRQPSMSDDGRFVAFESVASNLVAGDTNGQHDIFVRDRQSGVTERVSVDTGGAEGNFASGAASVSADGRFVTFTSNASNLVAGDTNGTLDVFVRDRQTGTTERVSVTTGGAQGNSGSFWSSISADGRFVAFASLAWNLVTSDGNLDYDIFVRDRRTGTTEHVSMAIGGVPTNDASDDASISADGRFVAYWSGASNLVAGDTNGAVDVFVHDRQSDTTERVSVATGGAQANGAGSFMVTISADGRFLAFGSHATNLVVGDTNGSADVFVRDRQNGTTERVSVDSAGTQAQGTSDSRIPTISADGRFVTFESSASNLVAGDSNGSYDVFVHDRQSGTTERVSVDSSGAQGNFPSSVATLSADGRFVAFESSASNLVAVDSNGATDVFVRDRGEPPTVATCFGDGTGAPCPCGNDGLPGHGCENSSSTGGALLTAVGSASLSADTLVLTSSGEKPMVLSIFTQGSDLVAPLVFGDGLLCVGGTFNGMFYVVIASGGVATAPQGTDPSVSARSAALGDPIPIGATRHYQTYYRDPDPGFCPSPLGNTWNISNALSAVWSP